jgi:hypothetical protein
MRFTKILFAFIKIHFMKTPFALDKEFYEKTYAFIKSIS